MKRDLSDLTGKRYGKLLVVGKEKSNGKIKWICDCDCGKRINVYRTHLKNGQLSCGCLSIENHRIDYGESCFNKVFRNYKYSANKKGVSFELKKDFFKEIIQKECFYCGKKSSQKCSRSDYYGEYFYTGIDRIDSSKGYTKDNVVPCCWQCNHAKNNIHQKEFLFWIKSVYNHLYS